MLSASPSRTRTPTGPGAAPALQSLCLRNSHGILLNRMAGFAPLMRWHSDFAPGGGSFLSLPCAPSQAARTASPHGSRQDQPAQPRSQGSFPQRWALWPGTPRLPGFVVAPLRAPPGQASLIWSLSSSLRVVCPSASGLWPQAQHEGGCGSAGSSPHPCGANGPREAPTDTSPRSGN